eukprot:403372906
MKKKSNLTSNLNDTSNSIKSNISTQQKPKPTPTNKQSATTANNRQNLFSGNNTSSLSLSQTSKSSNQQHQLKQQQQIQQTANKQQMNNHQQSSSSSQNSTSSLKNFNQSASNQFSNHSSNPHNNYNQLGLKGNNIKQITLDAHSKSAGKAQESDNNKRNTSQLHQAQVEIDLKNQDSKQQQTIANKYEQKIMSIDLSQSSIKTGGNRSLSKAKKNLFDDRSTSRERILTKKQGINTSAAIDQNYPNINTSDKGFGLKNLNAKLGGKGQDLQQFADDSQEYKNMNKVMRVNLGRDDDQYIAVGADRQYYQQEGDSQFYEERKTSFAQEDQKYQKGTNSQQTHGGKELKNFPFSQLQSQMNSLPYGNSQLPNYQERSSMRIDSNLGNIGGMNDFEYDDEENPSRGHGPIGQNFLDGLETVSQSVVSNSPSRIGQKPMKQVASGQKQQFNYQNQGNQYMNNNQSDEEKYDEEEYSLVESLHQYSKKNKNLHLTASKNDGNYSLNQISSQKHIVRNNLDLNLSEADNTDTKSFKTANNNYQRFGNRKGSDSEFKSALGNSMKKGSYLRGEINSHQDEFLSAHDQTLNLETHYPQENNEDRRQTYSPLKTNQTLDQNYLPDMQLSQIDHNNDGYQFTQDDIMRDGLSNLANNIIHSRKEERLKTQITQHLLEKILYENVIPSEIEQMAKNTILNFSTLNQSSNSKSDVNKSSSSQQDSNSKSTKKHSTKNIQIDVSILKLDSLMMYQESVLPNVLIGFLQDFFNATDGSHESEKALRRYVQDELIEQVNFNMCSEIWNDCLLIPHVMKEDPQLCFDNILQELVEEIAYEALRDMNHRQTLHSMVQQSMTSDYDNPSQNSFLRFSYTSQSQNLLSPTSSQSQTMQTQNNGFGISDTLNIQQLRLSYRNEDTEINEYIDNNLILNVCNNEVEDIVIQVMQDLIFQNKKLPKIVSQEIFNDFICNEIKQLAQHQMKKERLLNKGSDNLLQLFINQELEQVIIEAIDSQKQLPFKLAEETCDRILDQVTQDLIKQADQNIQVEVAQNLIINDILDLQLDKLITSLAQVSASKLQQENLIHKQMSEAILNDSIQNLFQDIILEAVQEEKNLKSFAESFIQKSLENEILDIVDQCVEEEVAHDQYDCLIDKIIENDIWRGTVMDLRNEEDAIYQLLEEWTDHYTGQFFIDHFGEIKDEYLKSYKEQMKQEETKKNEVSEYKILNSSQKLQLSQKKSDDSLNRTAALMMRDDPYTSANISRYQDPLNSSQDIHMINRSQLKVGSGLPANQSYRHQQNQSYGGYGAQSVTKSKINSSQFHSVKSELFYDCNEQDQQLLLLGELNQQQMLEDFDREKIDALYRDQENIQLKKLQNEFNFQDNDSVNFEDAQENFDPRDPTFETQSDILDETMQNLEIDEGTRRVPLIHSYYVIPEIRSLDFLNIKQKNFNSYFNQDSRIQQRNSIATKTMMLPVDAQAIDVLCVNCYECVKYEMVDEHSEQCLKNQQQKAAQQQNQIDRVNHYKQKSMANIDTTYPADLKILLNQDQFDQQNINLDHSYNFEEGRYILNQSQNIDRDTQLKAKEEMEYISELNERIFKLHKAIKQKQIEGFLPDNLNNQKIAADLGSIEYLSDVEYLAMEIFTNNTNKRELEINGSKLIDRIKSFKIQNSKDLSVSLLSKRLQQLTLQKIQTLGSYQELLGIKETDMYEVFSQNDEEGNLINNSSFYNDHPHGLSRSVSQSPMTFSKQKESPNFKSPQPKAYHNDNLISEEQFKHIDEEERKHKAELEVWRNLHNEILKNYLMTKGPLVGGNGGHNRQIHEINSDVSSKNDMISDNTSSYSSMTGASSSVNGSQFYNNFRGSVNQTPKQNSEVYLNCQNDNQYMSTSMGQMTFSPTAAGVQTIKSEQMANLFSQQRKSAQNKPSGDKNVSQFTIQTSSSEVQFQQQDVDESMRIVQNEEMKRHFYTMAIHNAKKILKIVPQGTILRQLYRKSQELQVGVKDWEGFIQNELRNMVK